MYLGICSRRLYLLSAYLQPCGSSPTAQLIFFCGS
jgi:hypothetical protein